MSHYNFSIHKVTIYDRLGSVAHELSGYTKQKKSNGRPVNIDLMTDEYQVMAKRLLREKKHNIKTLSSLELKNYHRSQGTMDELQSQKNNLDTEYNWKLRILLERSNNEKDAQIQKDAQLLLDFAKEAQERCDKKRKTVRQQPTVARRVSRRLQEKNNKQ